MTETPFLLYRDRDGAERQFSLEPGVVEASVGRAPTSDLVLDWDAAVSRLHAKVERDGDDWTLVDDGFSRNGTFVNGQRLNGRRRLNDGDALRFGATEAVFRAPASSAAPAPAPEIAQQGANLDLSTTQQRVLVALCRPYKGGNRFASPPSDEEIGQELFLEAGVVKTHLKVLFAKLEIEELPDDQRRIRLAERAISGGVITDADL